MRQFEENLLPQIGLVAEVQINLQEIGEPIQRPTEEIHRKQHERMHENLSQVILPRQIDNLILPKFNDIQHKKSLILPKLAKESAKFDPNQKASLPRLNLQNNSVANKKNHLRKKNDKSTLPQSTSLQLTKRKEKTLQDQFYLPAFIRNFELPQKKKVEIIPTMDVFKKRQALLRRFLSQPQTLKRYKILSHIGKGAFSIVSQGVDLQKNRKVAIKTYVKLDQIEDYKFVNIEREIQNMLKLNSHKNVVQIDAVVMDKRKLMIVMQNCGQQSLAGILRKKRVLTQSQAKHYFRQIVEGVLYCHENDICHRDLKLENILVDEFNNIKIIDFGFSCSTERLLSSICGTAPYMAPEIVSRRLYDGKKSDIWAIGVILYLLLYGSFPFMAGHENQLFRLIQYSKIHHNQTATSQAKEVINQILKHDPNERKSLNQILESKWLKQN